MTADKKLIRHEMIFTLDMETCQMKYSGFKDTTERCGLGNCSTLEVENMTYLRLEKELNDTLSFRPSQKHGLAIITDDKVQAGQINPNPLQITTPVML